MNPLLKHPILQKLPYDLMKHPDLEGIKDFLESQKKRIKKSTLITIGFFILFGIMNLIIYAVADDSSRYNLVIGIIAAVLIPLPFFIEKHEVKKFIMSDEEIVAEIKKTEEWTIEKME